MAAAKLSDEQKDELLATLEARFRKNAKRHPDITWEDVAARLDSAGKKLRTLHEMERTGGEPDVIGRDGKTGEFLFVDCSKQSPAGRRSLCFDREAWEARKEHKPSGSALEAADDMGVELLTEEQYRSLQELGAFDTTTSSWVQTPARIRKLGGALFCDRRYDTVFLYHNGAQSYYGARGFRGMLRV